MNHILFSVLLIANVAAAQTAIEWTGGQESRSIYSPGTVFAWRFLSGCDYDLEVTALGMYDHEGDGLKTAHVITISRLSGGPPIVSATVPAGTNSTLEGHFRFVPVPAVKLSRATDYVITSSNVMSSDDPYAFRAQGTVANPDVIYRGAGLEADPDSLAPGLFGPNFKTRATAVLAPATIRSSEVEICWASASNTLYQVQWRTALSPEAWQSLGGPVDGLGRTNCVTDAVRPGEPKRFYRILTLCYE